MTVNIYIFLLIVCFGSIAYSEVCYYDDGTKFGVTTLCAGTCCGTGTDPCCFDSGSLVAIAVGAIVSFVLVLICFVILCAQRAHAKRYTLQRQQRLQERLSELHTISNPNFEFTTSQNRPSDVNFNGNVELPPRYSDLYPRQNSSQPSSIDAVRRSATGSSSLSYTGSFNRNSETRRSFRRARNSSSLRSELNVVSELNQTSSSTTAQGQTEPKSASLPVADGMGLNKDSISGKDTSNLTVSTAETSSNSNTDENSSQVHNPHNLDRSSFLTSIADNLPSVFQSSNT